MAAPPDVDAADLIAEAERRAAARPHVPDPPELPSPFVGEAADPLERAREIAAHPGVEYDIGWQTPVLGQAWAALRQMVHDEARLYVDALMARQSELDTALLDAVGELRAEVAALREVIERGREDGGT